ncbi:PREDICTED: uncharacterized protein LOC109486220 [Branchiostoma belcheri]|uniref:Uncharacterized protein LOC109486220 n=1 Tax=Branchiostoma belcheri TaxID=7741 RepID=A0A6P5AQX2_BRABE|nr:PREDICTED: uncharacterized protein LOC109486220 [Branchiostoma belcheri]
MLLEMATNSTNDSLGLTNSTAFDWEPFYYADPPYRELQMVWLTACTVLGVCGNMALLITVSCVQELRTPGNALLCALAAADVLQLLGKVPMATIFLFNGKPLACDGVFLIIDTVYLIGAQFSINIIAPISIDRYWIWRELKRRQHSRINPETRSEMEYGETVVVPTSRVPSPESDRSPGTSDGGGARDEPFFSPFTPEDPTFPSPQPCAQAVSLSEVVSADVSLAEDCDKQDQISLESAGQFKPPQPVTLPWDGVQISPEFRARMRSATLVLLIVVAYVVSWAPYFGVIIRMNAVGDEASAATDGRWQRFAVLFSLLSTFSNPIIYAYRNPQLREGFFGLVRRGSL